MERYRSLFPVVEKMLFLNHASEAPVCRPVRQRVGEYLDIAEGDPDAAPGDLGALKALLARLLGGATEEYAAMPNTATGISLVANGLDWKPGDNVVVPEEEYPANVLPWLHLKHLGVELRRVPLDPQYRVDPGAVAALVDDRTRVVSVSAVEFLSGFRNDLKALSAIAHKAGALFVVDGIQACGAVPLNVEEDGIDLLCAGGYKWLLGPIGTGFAYIRRGVWEQIRPSLPGARSYDFAGGWKLWETAQRYETGCLPFSLLHGWTAGLELLLEAGVERIHPHLLELTGRAAAGLRSKGYTILSPMDRVEERSGIVVFSTGSAAGNEALAKRLYEQGIVIATRLGRCRMSPHFYNTPADIDRFLEAL